MQANYKPIAVAVLDIQKAFDSVAHEAIFNRIDELNIDENVKSYLKFIYCYSRTYLTFQNDNSGPIVSQGGSPKRPPITNFVFDGVQFYFKFIAC